MLNRRVEYADGSVEIWKQGELHSVISSNGKVEFFLLEKSNMNVKDVENAGYKVDITHFRRYEEVVMASNGRPKIVVVERPNQKGRVSRALPRGGRTEVVITDKDGETSTAVAVCGEKDMFQKALGVKIALGRLFGGKPPKKQ